MLRLAEQVLAALGGAWGLVVVGWATTLMSPPSVLWLLLVVVVAATPYVLALATLIPAGALSARSMQLAAATVLSLALAVVTGFSIGPFLLPATVALGGATGLAIAAQLRAGQSKARNA